MFRPRRGQASERNSTTSGRFLLEHQQPCVLMQLYFIEGLIRRENAIPIHYKPSYQHRREISMYSNPSLLRLRKVSMASKLRWLYRRFVLGLVPSIILRRCGFAFVYTGIDFQLTQCSRRSPHANQVHCSSASLDALEPVHFT